MLIKSRIASQVSVLREEIARQFPDFLEKFPISSYVREVIASRGWQRYYYLSPNLKKIFQEVLSAYGSPILARYHKLALTALMLNSLDGLEKKNIPPDIKDLHLKWYERVLNDVSSQPDTYYNSDDFSFLQDLAVCSLRAIPVGGAWLLEVSRGKLWQNSDPAMNKPLKEAESKRTKTRSLPLFQTLADRLKWRRFITLSLYRSGIVGLYYQLHTFPRYLLRFTPAEMEKSYLRIAELLRRNKRIRGLFRRSWFLDPQLENISPELAYLRKIPEKNGAKVFPAINFPNTIDNAIAMSPKRKKLYLAKTYTPRAYAYIWPRKKLLEWAEKQKDFPVTGK